MIWSKEKKYASFRAVNVRMAKVTKLLREVVGSSRPLRLQVEEGGGFSVVTSSFSVLTRQVFKIIKLQFQTKK